MDAGIPLPPEARRVIRTRAAGLALVLLLAGCASSGLTIDKQTTGALPDPPKPAAAAAAPVEMDAAAQREHERILAAYNGVYENPQIEAMVSETVEKLVAASDRPDLHYRITLLNSPVVNAFALPSGQLYVTRGLVALANDSSELASVMSHEMAHVIAHHAEIREDRARQVALVNRMVANGVLSDPEVGALALAKSKIALASFSRAQEFDADAMGVGIAAKAGFDPYGAARFLTALGHDSELRQSGQTSIDPRAPDFLSSHPATPERVKNAQAKARELGVAGGERDKAEYLAAIDGLFYGDDPSEGLVRGRRFLHPRLGFTFTAPEGFTLDNTAQAILGVKEGGGEALRLDVVRVPIEQTLADYLASGWIENIDTKSIDNYPINGFPASTAIAKGDQWTFRLFAVRFGSDVYRFIFATKHMTPEIDRSFRDSVATFRRMSLAESKATRPLRLKIVTVANGETVEQLASRMAVSDHKVERFRILNGLEANDRLHPGDQVKMVVE